MRKSKGKEGSYWNNWDGEMVINSKRYGDHVNKVIAHEFGHAVADHNGFIAKQILADLMKKQTKRLGFGRGGKLSDDAIKLRNRWGGGQRNDLKTYQNYQNHKKWRETQRNKFPELTDAEFKEDMGAVADWLGSLSTNHVGWGHTTSYMKKVRLRKHEFIAHAFENKFVGNKVFEYYFPIEYRETIDLLDELFKELKYDITETYRRILKSISE